jgi:L-aminopeptidase/D-esterase-like protein
MLDGDTVFALATGRGSRGAGNVTAIGTVAASVLAEAVVRAVRQASSLAGVPAAKDLV